MAVSQSVTITVGEAGQTHRPTALALVFWLAGLVLVGVSAVGLLAYPLRRRGDAL